MRNPPDRKSVRSVHSLGLAADNADVNIHRKDEVPALVWAASVALDMDITWLRIGKLLILKRTSIELPGR